jgi:hypothetical protein
LDDGRWIGYVDELKWVVLAMSAASTAMEASATATVESTTSVAVETATGIAVKGFTAVVAANCNSAAVAVCVGDWAAVDWASSVVASAIAVAAAEPGACSDEDSAGEPAGAVVAVGGAGVGRVVIVAVGAGGRAVGHIALIVVGCRSADSYANRDLRMGESDWDDQKAEQREIA